MFKKYGTEHPRFIVIEGVYQTQDGKWNRTCSCGKELKYSQRSSCIFHQRRNHLCGRCATLKRIETNGHPMLGRVGPNTGKRLSDSAKHKLSLLHRGKPKTEEHKEKLRLAAIIRVEKLGRRRGFNPIACAFIDQFGGQHGYRFRHAQNGGEVVISGYCLDGYDEKNNIIFEYDEEHHETSKQKEKDLKRTVGLLAKTGATMVRYSKKYGRTYRSTPTISEILS